MLTHGHDDNSLIVLDACDFRISPLQWHIKCSVVELLLLIRFNWCEFKSFILVLKSLSNVLNVCFVVKRRLAKTKRDRSIGASA